MSPSCLVLFNYDWDRVGFARWEQAFDIRDAGFDLFSFPSNVRLLGLDLERFTTGLAAQARHRGWQAVTSNHEQYGALAAALLAERMGWPGTPVAAVLACQHKLHARRLLQTLAPEQNPPFQALDWRLGEPIPDGIPYPVFVKPVKAAFSILARQVRDRGQLSALLGFNVWERWLIRRLLAPFDRVVQRRLPEAGSALRMLLEQPCEGTQYNLDGYVFDGQVRFLGVVESVMYPGTQAFMRFDYPCALPTRGRAQAEDLARRFLGAVGFSHGLFNLEFFYDPARQQLTAIEFNPRMAAQFSDLYLRVEGIDLHRIALELAFGRDPAHLPRQAPSAGQAASFVYRAFNAGACPAQPSAGRRQALARQFPDALLFPFPKSAGQIARDFKWLGSYRHGILHLGGRDARDLRRRCQTASDILGWQAPYAEPLAETFPTGPLPALTLEPSP